MMAAMKRMTAHTATTKGWDDEDFNNLKDALAQDNEKISTTLVFNLGWLTVPSQRRRALDLVGQRPIPINERKAWTYVFQQWLNAPNDPTIKSTLANLGNRDLQQVYHEIIANTAE